MRGHVRRWISITALLVGLLFTAGCRSMLPVNVKWAETPGKEVPQVRRAPIHYPDLDRCQKQHLFAGKPRVTIMFVDGLDLSGKRDYYTGYILPQGFAGFAMHPLRRNAPNMKLMDGTLMARTVLGWMKQNSGAQDGALIPWQAPPGVEFILIVEANGLDFKKGAVAEAEVFKAGGGVRTYGGLVSVHARLESRTGHIVATSNQLKDVPGITAYLKTSGVIEKMLVHAHLEAGEHEAFLNALQALTYIAVYDLFAQFYGDRTCDKDAQGIFDGEPLPEGTPPYKLYERPATAKITPREEAPLPVSCPIEPGKVVVETIFYDGHNDSTFDPQRNARQRETLQRIEEWRKKGCEIKIIEGARCPKPPKQGVARLRAEQPAIVLGKTGPQPPSVAMPDAKLALLWKTCSTAQGCDEDTYPWFYAAYVTLAHP